MQEKREQPIRLMNLILLLLFSLLIGTGWFFLFYATGYPWDFLIVLSGWGIARLVLICVPGGMRAQQGVLAILLTLLVIIVREYLLLSLVVSYTSAPDPSAARFALLPMTTFQLVLREELTLKPFVILLWMLSVGIAYITAIGFQRKITGENINN